MTGAEPERPPAVPTPSADGAVRSLGDFTTADRRALYLAALAAPIGLVAAGAAVLLLGLIGFFTNLFYFGRISWTLVSPAGNPLGVLAVGIPVAGGLVIGLMARYGSERIRGHGIPEAIESILANKGRLEPRVAVLKPLSSAISIGSGGPFGAEGPIIMTAGSIGSVFGQTLRISAAERKTLLVAGAAAGMAATFNTPFAAVLLAVELLLFEWRPRSLIPVGVATAVATVARWPVLGAGALFPLPPSPVLGPSGLLGAVGLGLVVGAVATALTWAVYGFEDLFRRLPVHWMWWPAIGGVAVGLGGLVDPRALGVGYGSIDLILIGGLGVAATATLLVVKSVIWTAALGSGTSGGVLAPLLMVGAATGMLVGPFLPGGTPAIWPLVGLGAILGGTMRVPFTGVVFALELTRDWGLVFGLLVASLAAYSLTVFTLQRSILTEKVARRNVHATREYAVDPLEVVPVRAVMRTEIVPVPADLSVEEVAGLVPESSSRFVGHPLLDDAGRFVGFVTHSEIATYLAEGGAPAAAVRSVAPAVTATVEPDHPVRFAASLLAERDLEVVPVVAAGEPPEVVGLFTREELFRACVLAMEDERRRDRLIRIPLPRRSSSGRTGPDAGESPPRQS